MRTNFKWFFAIFMLPLCLGMIYFSLVWRSPELAAHRILAGGLFVTITLALIAGLSLAIIRFAGNHITLLRIAKIGVGISIAALLIFFAKEIQFQWIRYSVLNADPETLSRLGRHFVIGFRSQGFAEELIVRKGASGIFITAHNIHGQDAASIHATLERFQSLRQSSGAKPLWIATDQEGGRVSRMSPPLVAQPSLGELIKQYPDIRDMKSAVRAYGRTQGVALAALGINLNFAPVVDINYNIVNQEDRYTRIYQRAISSDPHMVEQVAGWYCDALYESGVRCTLKHFPGLGQVQTDTHLDTATLTLSTQTLTKSDWLPFKSLMQRNYHPFTMLSHVHLDAVDPTQPVSTSKRVADNLLRKEWHYDGILITDDFSMAAIYQRPGGIGAATVDALNAGVDLILISFDPDQYYPAMFALLEAERNGKVDREMLERSRDRLDSVTMP